MITSDALGKKVLAGINTPYLYIGGFRTIFAWHVEDLNMASLNYNHYGAPKFWYGISRADYKKFENFVKNRMPERFLECNELLRHKTVLINPYLLKTILPDIKIIKLFK